MHYLQVSSRLNNWVDLLQFKFYRQILHFFMTSSSNEMKRKLDTLFEVLFTRDLASIQLHDRFLSELSAWNIFCLDFIECSALRSGTGHIRVIIALSFLLFLSQSFSIFFDWASNWVIISVFNSWMRLILVIYTN